MLLFIIGLVIGFAISFAIEAYKQRKAMNTYGEYEEIIENMSPEELDELVSTYDCGTPEENYQRYSPRHRMD